MLLSAPTAAAVEVAIYPVLGLLGYATFLQVPFDGIASSLRESGASSAPRWSWTS